MVAELLCNLVALVVVALVEQETVMTEEMVQQIPVVVVAELEVMPEVELMAVTEALELW